MLGAILVIFGPVNQKVTLDGAELVVWAVGDDEAVFEEN
jgi:hypothetical protein